MTEGTDKSVAFSICSVPLVGFTRYVGVSGVSGDVIGLLPNVQVLLPGKKADM